MGWEKISQVKPSERENWRVSILCPSPQAMQAPPPQRGNFHSKKFTKVSVVLGSL